ncbi:C2 family cysteine protease [Frankia sp. R82]|uniref:C2 family cysteine protease n=1 Tax=Frankia sp. R82 TaxID=2950553 RepID=UPI0020433AFC|nr:C2 family cysteine protease [Frankia sp. R82]MCM3883594.1 C2 family cysteine protease [Frankia sp. R82]
MVIGFGPGADAGAEAGRGAATRPATRCADELATGADQFRRQAAEASAVSAVLASAMPGWVDGPNRPGRPGDGPALESDSPLAGRLRGAMVAWHRQLAAGAEVLRAVAGWLDRVALVLPPAGASSELATSSELANLPGPLAMPATGALGASWPAVAAVRTGPAVVIRLAPDELRDCAGRLHSVGGRAAGLGWVVARSVVGVEPALQHAMMLSSASLSSASLSSVSLSASVVGALREVERALRAVSAGALAAAVDLECRLARLVEGVPVLASGPTPARLASSGPGSAGQPSALAIAAGVLEAIHLTTSGSPRGGLAVDTLRAARSALARLPAAARAAVVAQVPGEDLAALGARAAWLAASPSRLADPSARGLVRYAAELAGLADELLAAAPAEMIHDLVRELPWLEPAPPARPAGQLPLWADRSSEPLVRDGVEPDDVGQGTVPDCYLAAALVGIAAQDPDQLVRGIRRNPNGTATVTLHPGVNRDRGAGPLSVTVTATLAQWLVRTSDDGPPVRQELAADADNAGGRGELWPALYEKAFARLRGGYPALGYGSTTDALATLTGHRATGRDARHLHPDDLAAALGRGEVVLITTRQRTRPAGLVAAHAYAVLAVDTGRGQVLLRNPWDPPATGSNEQWYDWAAVSPDVHTVVCGATR